jgi:hypothetical protein
MNINQFNSKVNLPKFCAKLGYDDYQFIKIPTFGWFAYNHDKSFIGNIFDIVSQKDREYLYALISKDKPEYLDFDLSYSSIVETSIKYDIYATQLWTAVYAYAKKELETYRINYKGKRVRLKEVLLENGFGALLTNNVGIITTTLMEKFNMLPWPKRELRGKILIPSFFTPMHIASLEYCSWDEPTDIQPLWLNDEKGWYGNIEHRTVVSSLRELWVASGNTWDYKVDYWYPKNIVTLSDSINVGDAIRIWTEANNTTFNQSPLAKIIENGKVDELKHHIGNLTYQQLQEVETLTGEALVETWKKAREHQVHIGSYVFTRRDNCYWVFKKGKLEQVTNFAIDINKIIKQKNGKFSRHGTLFFGNTGIPFEMDERYFTTNYMFQRGIKDKFLTSGLGVPIIHPDFFNKALLIIDSFNQGVELDTSEGQNASSLE